MYCRYWGRKHLAMWLADCHSASHTIALLFSCPSHPTHLATEDIWVAQFQVTQFKADLPQFAGLPNNRSTSIPSPFNLHYRQESLLTSFPLAGPLYIHPSFSSPSFLPICSAGSAFQYTHNSKLSGRAGRKESPRFSVLFMDSSNTKGGSIPLKLLRILKFSMNRTWSLLCSRVKSSKPASLFWYPLWRIKGTNLVSRACTFSRHHSSTCLIRDQN